MSTPEMSTADNQLDVIIVGAGFSGLYALHRMRQLGLSARVLEAASGVGGTWYWNRYPGARCDVESVLYSYSFSPELEQEWRWSERYASQPELLNYLNHVADRFDLRGDIQLDTRVAAVTFDDPTGRWRVRPELGDVLTAQYVIMATGCLSTPQNPAVPGIDTFAGKIYHTGRWPHEPVDFTGQRVGVIGTGSSAIQSIPLVAEQAAALVVFQRTPNFSVPAHNEPLDPQAKVDYSTLREQARQSWAGIPAPTGELNLKSALEVAEPERTEEYERQWANGGLTFLGAFTDLVLHPDANETAAEFIRTKIATLVADPGLAEQLSPRSFPVGTKRICVDTGYYETFNRANVTLVDLRDNPIEEISGHTVRTAIRPYEVDSLILATGFDAMTGTLLNIDIRGRDGMTLRSTWAAGPQAYLGLAVAGYPNLFLITGPGSPSVLTNMVVSIEQHVDWIADLVEHARQHGVNRIEPTEQAQQSWLEHVETVANYTLYPQANSWYRGANVPGKPQVFMAYAGGVPAYREHCAEVAAQGYQGFTLTG